MKDMKKLADVWDEKTNFQDEDRLIASETLFRQLREILLLKNRDERDRILRNLLGLKPRKKRRPSFMGEVWFSDDDSRAVDSDSKLSDSYILHAQKSDYDRQLSQWRALGEISENLPRPIIRQARLGY